MLFIFSILGTMAEKIYKRLKMCHGNKAHKLLGDVHFTEHPNKKFPTRKGGLTDP